MSVLDKLVSYYPSIISTTKGVDLNLLSILQSNKHKVRILNLRSSDEITQKLLKAWLPCFNIAGTFSERNKSGLLTLSGLAAVDLDSAEDYDVLQLLNELKKIDCIAYAGLSCRGKRLFCIVHLLYPEKYEMQYERLIQSFKDMRLPMGDECHKNISQPRFVSWNDESTQFFNHDAKPYHLLAPEKVFHHIQRTTSKSFSESPKNPFQWCNEQVNKSHSFIDGSRHEYIIQLARYCNIKGVSHQDTLNGSLNYIQADFTAEEITDIVKHIYTAQTDSHNKYPFTERSNQPQALPLIDNKPIEIIQEQTPVPKIEQVEMSEPKPEKWDQQIAELECFFQTISFPVHPIKLDSSTTIIDVYQCIQSHLSVVKTNNGNRTFEPYLQRLIEIKQKFIS